MAKSIAKLSVSLTASTGKFTKGMKDSTKSTESLMTGLKRTSKQIAAFAAAGAAAAFGFMAMQIRKAAGAIDSLAKSAARLGTTAATLQFLRFQANLFGISAEQMDKATMDFTRRLGEAVQTGGMAARALDTLGISAESLLTMPLDQQMDVLRKALMGVESQAERVNLAYQIMGRQGAMLVPMLTQQDAAAQAIRDRFDALNITLSQADTSAVESMNDSISILRQLMDALWQRVTVAVAPAIDAFSQSLEKGVAQSDMLGRATKVIVKSLAVGVAVVKDITRGFRFLFQIAKLSILGTLDFVFRFVESLSSVAVSIAEFTGIGVKSAQQFQATIMAMSDSITEDVRDTTNAIREMADEQSAVLSLGETFAEIDRRVDSIGKGTEEIAHNMEQASIDTDKMLEDMEAMDRFAEQIKEQTMTPLEQFERQIEMLRKILERGLIDDETFRRAIEQAEKALADATATVGESVAEPKTSDFRQIRLSQVSLDGVRSPSARPTEIFSPQIEELITLNRQILNGGAFARVGA